MSLITNQTTYGWIKALNSCKTMKQKYIQHMIKGNLLLLKDLLEPYRTNFTNN